MRSENSNISSLLKSEVSVYPNPISSFATIAFSLENKAEISINLYDASGREVIALFKGELAEGDQKIELNMSNLISGIYIMQIITGSEVQRLKVTIN